MNDNVISVGPAEAVAVNLPAGSKIRSVREGRPDAQRGPSPEDFAESLTRKAAAARRA